MKKHFWLILAAVAALGFAAAPAMARGGGHGGGHGGHHGGAHHGAHHSAHHANHHHGDHHYHHSHWAHHNRPFSRGWYGRHGGAWGYGWGGWGWSNPWAVTTLGAAAGWLGAEDLAGGWGAYAEPATVYTSDDDSSDDADSDEPQTNDADEDTPIEPAEQAARRAEAAKLAQSGQSDPPKETAFLPLGVFTLAPKGQAEASALVQLAIAKDGAVRGTYYDLLSDHDHPLRGAVDKRTGRVAFTFGPKGKVTFETTLASLTQAKGSLGVHYENGSSSVWTLARYEKEPQDEAAKPEAQQKREIPVQVEPEGAPGAAAQP